MQQFPSVKWQVKFPKGWQDLPHEASSKIEAAFHGCGNVAEYEQCWSKKKNLWQPYQLDFRSMKQTNVSSGSVREARRIQVPLLMNGDGAMRAAEPGRSRTPALRYRDGSSALPVDEPIDSIFNEGASFIQGPLQIEDLPRESAVCQSATWWLGPEPGSEERAASPKKRLRELHV